MYLLLKINMNEINTLKDATNFLGISYLAARHMTQFAVVNETAITEDLSNGLLYEWLEFIIDHTDSNTNDFEEAVIQLFLDLLGDNMELILLADELDRMMEDSDYAGIMAVIIQDSSNNKMERIPIRLKLRQYILFLEIGSK
jgi:hypothetical protein